MNRIIVADWNRVMPEARAIRDLVFVQEQGVPLELEWDEFDAVCWHAIAYDSKQRVCGTGRLYPRSRGSAASGVWRYCPSIEDKALEPHYLLPCSNVHNNAMTRR